MTTEPLDTGDIVENKFTHEEAMVACVHEPYLHTCGFPEHRWRISDVILVYKASLQEHIEQLKALASSTSTGHRAKCARSRLTYIGA